MSNALALVTDDIYNAKDAFMSVLADRSINFEREAGFAIQTITSGDYILSVAASDRQSVINAVTNIAAIGISLNPAKKQAYLVPRNRKICLDISYMGLMDLAMDTGSIRWAQAELVCENDGFARGRFDEPPTHTFNPFSKDRGPIVGVYVVVKTADGDYLTHTMEISAVMDIRDRSEAWKAYVAKKAKSCPWATDEGEMVKKTCVKQAYKYWPKTERLEKAIHYLNMDGGEGLDINKVPEKPADWIDVTPLIAEAVSTKTDADALAYWKANNGRLVKQANDHAKFKDAVMAHRASLKAKDEARTVEMPTATAESAAAFDAGLGQPEYVPE
jgi:recombination protein RecT